MNNIKKYEDSVKLHIAMSEFTKDYTFKKNSKYLFLNKIAILFIVFSLLIIGGIKAKDIVKFFENREPSYIVESISESIANGYVENLNMDYNYSDNIGFKIKSFSMSENDINLVLDFKLNEYLQLDVNDIEYSYILYNQDNYIYYIMNGTNKNIIEDFIKQKNINNIDLHVLNAQQVTITRTDNNIIISNLISTKDFFPKAKKLYIDIIGIGYFDNNNKYIELSNSKWNIELDIPDKFYSNIAFNYKQETVIDNINIEKLMVTDTSTTFIAEIPFLNTLNIISNNIYITDENQNIYKTKSLLYENDKIICQFPITKNNTTDILYVNIIINGKDKIIKLKKL